MLFGGAAGVAGVVAANSLGELGAVVGRQGVIPKALCRQGQSPAVLGRMTMRLVER